MSALAARPAASAPRATRSTGRVNFAALASACLVFSLAPLGLLWAQAAERGRLFLGTAGSVPGDQLQYLAWARDAAAHGLIRNLYGHAGTALFIHPIWTLDGLVQGATGIPDAVAMAFWTAAGALAFAAGTARLVTRFIPAERRGRRACALALAAFGGLTPALGLVTVLYGADEGGVVQRAGNELIPAMSLWGYAPQAIALGLLPFALERYEALLAGRTGARAVLSAGALGLLVAWLHPWQGQILIAAELALCAWELARPGARGAASLRARLPTFVARRAGPVLIATAAPLVYYLVLSRADSGWALSARLSQKAALIPWPVVLLGVLPLVLGAALAARRAARQTDRRPLIALVVATLAALALSRTGQYRALDGFAIPVAVLLVATWPRAVGRSAGWVTAAAVLTVLVPTGLFVRGALRELQSPPDTRLSELAPDDVRAARLAARVGRGGPLLSDVALGTALPALTDDPSWLGHPIWTPEVTDRELATTLLFDGDMGAGPAAALLRAAAPAAVVQPCRTGVDIAPLMRALGLRRLPVGCASVYVPAYARPALHVQPSGRPLNSAPTPADHSAYDGTLQH
jgi:hypothetical protein